MIPWIKNHPGQTAVVALTLGLAASSTELYRQYTSFSQHVTGPVPVAAMPLSRGESTTAGLDAALAAARDPSLWTVAAPNTARLFAAKPYVALNGTLQRPEGRMFHPPVPNNELIKAGLNPLDPNVLASDPDQDGFTTLVEWEGVDTVSHLDRSGNPVIGADGRILPDDSTNPADPASHPPYHTRLFVERIEQIPFHLRFLSHDIDPKNRRPVSVQINATPGKTEFIAVGEPLKSAPFDVKSFTAKEVPGPDGTTRDVSEVVVVDRRNKEEVSLPLRERVNSPESYAILRHEWTSGKVGSKPATFRLRKNEIFQLPPTGEIYRVTDVRADRVEITTPSGEKYFPRHISALNQPK